MPVDILKNPQIQELPEICPPLLTVFMYEKTCNADAP